MDKQVVVEDLWKLIGGFGRYPFLVVAFIDYVTIVAAFQHFALIFYGAPPDHQCMSDVVNVSSSCGINQCGCGNCTYVFMTDEFSSAVSEWNLICDRAHLRAMTQSVYIAGCMVGCLLFGQISDRIGRKKALFLSLLLSILFGLGSAFSDSLALFAVMRFCTAVANTGCVVIRMVYCMELSNIANRTVIAITSSISFPFGAVVLTLLSYLLRDWRHLMLAISLPGVPLLLLWKWIPESFQWLIAKGRLQEAQQVLESFASASSVEVDSNKLASTIKEIKMKNGSAATAKNTTGILDLIRTPKMRKRTAILSLNWFATGVLIYGILVQAKNLGGSFYLNTFILVSPGLAATFIVLLLFKKFGRRIPFATVMITGGVLSITIFAISNTKGEDPAIKVLAVICILCGQASFCGLFIYSPELCPTLLRNVGLGVVSMMSRVGGTIAPYIVFLNKFLKNLPFMIFGVLALSAGIAALFLPETLFSPMPQTVEQVEAWDEDYGVPCLKKRRLAGEPEYSLIEESPDD